MAGGGHGGGGGGQLGEVVERACRVNASYTRGVLGGLQHEIGGALLQANAAANQVRGNGGGTKGSTGTQGALGQIRELPQIVVFVCFSILLKIGLTPPPP